MPVFTDGSDLNGVQKVEDISYMKQLRFAARLINAWPMDDVSMLSLVFKMFRMVVFIACLISGIIYLRNKTGLVSAFDLGHQYITLILLIVSIDSPSLARYGPLAFYNFQQLIQLSIIFELLNSSNDALIDAIYNLPWECMDHSSQKIVNIMLIVSQRSMTLKPMDMITVGVQTMIKILKTSISYFLMIKAFAED